MPTSPSTPPRTCLRSRRRDSRSQRFPSAPIPATRSSARPSRSFRWVLTSRRARCGGGPQLAGLRPDLTFAELRGNIPTRLHKATSYDAVVIAAAALDRLGLAAHVAERLDPAMVLPQVAQGALAIECRAEDEETIAVLRALEDATVRPAVDAERAFLEQLGGGCNLPCGALGDGDRRGRRRGDRRDRGPARVARRADRPPRPCRGPRAASSRGRGRTPSPRRPRRPVPARGRRVTVYLVGAGPGDPALMTLRGAELLGRADVVVYDRLAADSLLDLAPPSAERISVGKAPGRVEMTQDEINALLVERGASGATVVRLKGGDPFVFGRGGRGGRSPRRRRCALRGRPGHHERDRSSRLRRDTGDTPRPVDAFHGRHRPRGSDQGLDRRRLGGACPRRRHARDPDGGRSRRRDRPPSRRGRARTRDPRRRRAQRHEARPAHDPCHARHDRERRRADRRARSSSAKSPHSTSRGSRRGPCSVAASS